MHTHAHGCVPSASSSSCAHVHKHHHDDDDDDASASDIQLITKTRGMQLSCIYSPQLGLGDAMRCDASRCIWSVYRTYSIHRNNMHNIMRDRCGGTHADHTTMPLGWFACVDVYLCAHHTVNISARSHDDALIKMRRSPSSESPTYARMWLLGFERDI